MDERPVIIRNPLKKFTYTQKLVISALGTSSSAAQLLIEDTIGITKAVVTAYCIDGTGKSQAVVQNSTARDPLLINIRRESGENIMSDPLDMFAFNAEFDNNPGFAGWLLYGATKLTFVATHDPVGTAIFPAAPIVLYVALSGYKQ